MTALGPSTGTWWIGRDVTAARLVVEVAFDAARYDGEDRTARATADRAAFDAALARLEGGTPLAVSCSLDGDVPVSDGERASVLTYLGEASRHLGALLGGDPAPEPARVTLRRTVSAPDAPCAREVTVSLRARDATTPLAPPDDLAEGVAKAFAGEVLVAQGPGSTVWAVRLAAPYELSPGRVYALAPLSTVPLAVTVAVAGREQTYVGVDLDGWARTVLAALEAADSPGLARIRTRLASAIAAGLRGVTGDEADDDLRAALTERLLHSLADVPDVVVRHDLAAPLGLDVIVEGPRTHALARDATRLTYVGAPRSPVTSSVASVRHDGAVLALSDPPVTTAEVHGFAPVRALPAVPAVHGAGWAPRDALGDDLDAAVAAATEWTYRLAYGAPPAAGDDVVEVSFAAAAEAPAFARRPAPEGALLAHLARIQASLPAVLPNGVAGPGAADALAALADGLDVSWAAWVAAAPPAPIDVAAVTIREDEVEGALRVTVAYALGGLVPRVLVDDHECVDAEPAAFADNRPTRAWAYVSPEGTPLAREGAPPGRTFEVAGLDALRQPVASAALRVVRNPGAAPEFVYATAPVTSAPVTPSPDHTLPLDAGTLAGLVAAAARPGVAVEAEVVAAYAVEGGGSVPVTRTGRGAFDAAYAAALTDALRAWAAERQPAPGTFTLDVTLYGTEPASPVRLRDLRLVV